MPLYDNADAILTSGVQANSTTLFSGGRALSILSRSGPAMGMMDPEALHVTTLLLPISPHPFLDLFSP